MVKLVNLNPSENASRLKTQEEKVRWKAGQPGFASAVGHLRQDRFTREGFIGLFFLREEQGYWEYRVATLKIRQARKRIAWLEI